MKRQKPVGGSHQRRVLLPENISRSDEIVFSSERWRLVSKEVPRLSAEADEALMRDVAKCCSEFLSKRRLLQQGGASAAAIQRPGKGQGSPLERVVKNLKAAAGAWDEIGDIYDDRLGDIDQYKQLALMAKDADRRLSGLKRLKPRVMAVRPDLVGSVARCCRKVGLVPTATGRAYEGATPTWFQALLLGINDHLLGDLGWGANGSYSTQAVCAEIAKSLRGDKPKGKARK